MKSALNMDETAKSRSYLGKIKISSSPKGCFSGWHGAGHKEKYTLSPNSPREVAKRDGI